jgi:hypothetical protein
MPAHTITPNKASWRTRRDRRVFWLVVLAALLVAVLSAVAVGSATAGPQSAAAAQLDPAQPPLPFPPNPDCAPGSAEPACHLPSASSVPPIPATPLPPITTAAGQGAGKA